MKRFKHSLSHYKLLTCDMGELIPIACYEALPGDSIQQASSVLLRVSPLLAPVMHPVSVRIHHWFVPNRLIWNAWEDFITGGPDGADNSTPPFTTILASTPLKDTLWDYFGIPPGGDNTVSSLPVRAYNKVYNEFYRDADLVAEVAEDDGSVKKVAWEKDYFSAARPWPQKGPDITLPLGVRAPVKGILAESGHPFADAPAGKDSTGASVSYSPGAWVNVTAGSRFGVARGGSAGVPDIYADLTNATATNINDVRKAFAMQRYQEARAQYGSRYTEYLRYLGIRSSDARLQRPEYLGGGKATISFSEVLQTGPGSDPDESVVGDLKGHGISALRSRRYRRFFEEHGIVLSLLSVRPRTMYAQATNRMFMRANKEDYWQKELELIGQQPIYTREVYAQGADMGTTFGWGDRYSEYRHIQSTIAGDFRDTLNFWHLARDFAAPPVLNQSFIECSPSKRINAVQTEDTLWVMANHSIQARRMVTKKTIGRIV